jgi:double-stranded uracil-DNA glycosylase
MNQIHPSKEEILAAKGKTVADVIADGLEVLFCGINPGLYSGAVGHHFARPGNRFWPVLYAAGFTDRLLSPFEERLLLEAGYGITNFVSRATANASELSREELTQGAKMLETKLQKTKPRILAVLGIGAYRLAFKKPKAAIGKQENHIGGTTIWVLPNPSGINAHYQIDDLIKLFKELRLAIMGR